MKTLAVVLLLGGVALADDPGNRIDQCKTAPDGSLHCTTPNSRFDQAHHAVKNLIYGFDHDQRIEDITNALLFWEDNLPAKDACRAGGIDTYDVFNVYHYPGFDPESDAGSIRTLKGCTLTFTLWLYKRENRGRSPEAVAKDFARKNAQASGKR